MNENTFKKVRTLSKVRISPWSVLRIELHADHYGGRGVLLQLTEYAKGGRGGLSYSGQSKLLLPVAAAASVIGVLTEAVASIEHQQPREPTLRNTLQQSVQRPRVDVADVLRLQGEGLTPAQIAGRLGCNRSTVGRILKKLPAPPPAA